MIYAPEENMILLAVVWFVYALLAFALLSPLMWRLGRTPLDKRTRKTIKRLRLFASGFVAVAVVVALLSI